MGTQDGRVILTPRLEAYESALRIAGVPRPDWAEMVEWATWLHYMVNEPRNAAYFIRDLGVDYATMKPEEVADHDAN